MAEQVTTVGSRETAMVLVRQNAIIRLASMACAFVFWCVAALLWLVLFLHDFLPYKSLVPFVQAVSLIGLSPLAAAVLTWKAFEFALSSYIERFSRKHLQQ